MSDVRQAVTRAYHQEWARIVGSLTRRLGDLGCAAEAIRLMPEDGEVALMLLIEARRPARVSATGELVPRGEQDREAWNATLIAQGHQLVRERLASVALLIHPLRE